MHVHVESSWRPLFACQLILLHFDGAMHAEPFILLFLLLLLSSSSSSGSLL